MKKVNLRYCASTYEQFVTDFQKLLNIFVSDKGTHLEINLVLDKISEKDIKKIVTYITNCKKIKQITEENIYTFVLTINPSKNYIKLMRRLKRLLSRIDVFYKREGIKEIFYELYKEKIPCSLLINEKDINEVYKIYRENRTLGIPIYAECEVKYDDDFYNTFRNWIYDKNGCRINIFTDVLSKVLLDYWGTKCQYKSCLTKYFEVDYDGNIYCCNKNKNKLCRLKDINSLNQLYSCDVFTNLLKGSIEKREKCKDACEYYGLCQGGCPLKSSIPINECEDKLLFAMIKKVTPLLINIVNNSDYSILNPTVRDMILSGVASNKVFLKGLYD